jgi:hypothetical protein
MRANEVRPYGEQEKAGGERGKILRCAQNDRVGEV